MESQSKCKELLGDAEQFRIQEGWMLQNVFDEPPSTGFKDQTNDAFLRKSSDDLVELLKKKSQTLRPARSKTTV